MSVSAEMYIVISLMFAVFAAVAAVGTSIVLGAGFERLRAGFEIVRKQTGFFADAIHKLDERTKQLGAQSLQTKETVAVLSDKVERVEKQTGFFADAIQSLELKLASGLISGEEGEQEEPILPREMDYLRASIDTPHMEILRDMSFLNANSAGQPEESVAAEAPHAPQPRPQTGLSNLLTSYFRGEGSGGAREVTYH